MLVKKIFVVFFARVICRKSLGDLRCGEVEITAVQPLVYESFSIGGEYALRSRFTSRAQHDMSRQDLRSISIGAKSAQLSDEDARRSRSKGLSPI